MERVLNACSSGETRITTTAIIKFAAGNTFTIRSEFWCKFDPLPQVF